MTGVQLVLRDSCDATGAPIHTVDIEHSNNSPVFRQHHNQDHNSQAKSAAVRMDAQRRHCPRLASMLKAIVGMVMIWVQTGIRQLLKVLKRDASA